MRLGAAEVKLRGLCGMAARRWNGRSRPAVVFTRWGLRNLEKHDEKEEHGGRGRSWRSAAPFHSSDGSAWDGDRKRPYADGSEHALRGDHDDSGGRAYRCTWLPELVPGLRTRGRTGYVSGNYIATGYAQVRPPIYYQPAPAPRVYYDYRQRATAMIVGVTITGQTAAAGSDSTSASR